MPQFTVSKPLRITVKGVDSYREAGVIPESHVRKDCEAYAFDEARRIGVEFCHAEGGALRGAGHLTTKLLEDMGAAVSIDRGRSCSFEVVAAFTCDLPEESQRVRTQTAPPGGLPWVNQREIPAWDGKVSRSRHEFYVAADWAQSKAMTRTQGEKAGAEGESGDDAGQSGDFSTPELVDAYFDEIQERDRRAMEVYEAEMSQAQQARDKARRDAAEEAEREARRNPYTLPQ